MKTCVPSVRGKRILLVTALWLSLGPYVFSSDLLVYNNHDNGAGSLRQAISDNNAMGGSNTVVFSNTVFGTIGLTSGALVISKSLDIIGPGANVLAVSGKNFSWVFVVSNATVSVSGLTVRDGHGSSIAGGIFNYASSTLTISNCTVSGNLARFGGGIENNFSTLKLIDSTVSGNGAERGGGIENNGGNITISNCTISGNLGSTSGGGIYNGFGSAMTVTASTFSGNSSGDGGAIFNQGTLEIGNTILKAGASGININGFGGQIISRGYNLCSDGGSGVLSGVGDQINTNPILGPLQDNGGPTPTHMPLPGSPAIDQGNSFGLTTDQRGRSRSYDDPAIPNASFGDGTDIGAVEFSPTRTLVVSNTNDQVIGSLRQAIVDAAPGDSITFATNVTGTITLTGGELLIGKSLTIQGPGANILAVNGNAVSRVFHTSNGVSAVSGLTITNGYTSGSGGGILNSHSTLTVSNCLVAANSAGSYGGGIFNDGSSGGGPATFAVIGSTLSGNSSGGGGAIYNDGETSGSATLMLTNCILRTNSAGAGRGGGIYNDATSGSTTCTLWACLLSGNTGAFTGGGIFNNSAPSGSATLAVIASTFHGNSSANGGAIYNDGEASGNSTLTLTNCTLSTNSAVTGHGGGIYNDGYTGVASCALWACTLSGNTSGDTGGGVFNNGASGSATASFANTILKAGASGANIENASGSVVTYDYNLSSDNPGAGFTTGTLGTQVNTDPLLGPLRDNGGPTPTMALLSNSPAIDKGKSLGLTTDQRGAPRPFDFATSANAGGGDGSDIGAFELGSPTLNIQMFTTDAVLSWESYYGDFTLESVTNVNLANAWTAVGGTPEVSGNQYVFTNGPITGNTFYRLKGN